MPPQFQNGPAGGGAELDDEDLEDLLEMVRDPAFARDSSGFGNNTANPTWGTAGHQFIRLTDPHYTDGASGIRETALTPREISDILSNQDNTGDGVEESIPNAFGGTSLLTFFGQYFDHGLDFVAKGEPGNVAIGSDTFPMMHRDRTLFRARVSMASRRSTPTMPRPSSIRTRPMDRMMR